MADYQITAPDGLQHTVSAPDGADSDSILGFAKTVLDNAKQGISNAWDKTEPARVQVGALMSGDPQTALDSLKGQIAGVTKRTRGSHLAQRTANRPEALGFIKWNTIKRFNEVEKVAN